MIRLSALALCVVVSPASAETYINLGHGRYLELTDGALPLLALLLLVGLFAVLYDSLTQPRTSSYQMPQQVIYPDTADDYESEAARLRALKHKLDAETELTESYIKAERKKAEAEELSEILAHDKAMRSGGGSNG
jgi:hypothetical protein